MVGSVGPVNCIYADATRLPEVSDTLSDMRFSSRGLYAGPA